MSDSRVVAGVSDVVDGADGVQTGRLTPPYPGAVRVGSGLHERRRSAWELHPHLLQPLVARSACRTATRRLARACPRDDLSARCHGTSVLKGAAYVLRDRATSTALGFLASAERGMAAGARAVASYRPPMHAWCRPDEHHLFRYSRLSCQGVRVGGWRVLAGRRRRECRLRGLLARASR